MTNRMPPARSHSKNLQKRPVPARNGGAITPGFVPQRRVEARVAWAVGMTTAHRGQSTINRTLDSLAKAGWRDVTVFADGACHVPDLPGVSVVRRSAPAGPFANWWLMLQELYMRAPNAERYLTLEDDVVFCQHVRQYLESQPPPSEGVGVIGLYTSQSVKFNRWGWGAAAPMGIGALAYMFTNEMLRRVLSSPDYFLNHRKGKHGHKWQDTALANWCKDRGLKEMRHKPSLSQHIGDVSSFGNGPNAGKRTSSTFAGEDFDATLLLSVDSPVAVGRRPPARKVETVKPAPKRQARQGEKIALLGWNVDNEIGRINRDVCDHLDIDKWFVKGLGGMKTLAPHDLVDTTSCPANCPRTEAKLRGFLRDVKLLLWVDNPIVDSISAICEKMGVKTACLLTGGIDTWPDADLYIDLRGKQVESEAETIRRQLEDLEQYESANR